MTAILKRLDSKHPVTLQTLWLPLAFVWQPLKKNTQVYANIILETFTPPSFSHHVVFLPETFRLIHHFNAMLLDLEHSPPSFFRKKKKVCFVTALRRFVAVATELTQEHYS